MNTRRQTRSSTRTAVVPETEAETPAVKIPATTKKSNETKKKESKVKIEPKQKASEKKDKKGKVKVEEEQKDEQKDETDQEDVEILDEDDVIFQLSEKEMKEVNNAFDLNCSDDGQELLSSDDLKTAIRALGFEPRVHEIRKLLQKHANKDGKINRNGFHNIMASKMGNSLGASDNQTSNDEISRVFNLLDLDKTGLITLDNLKSIAKELNEGISELELREMISEADHDGDSKINKLEFQNIMKKTSLY